MVSKVEWAVVALVLVGIIVSSSTLYYGFSVTGKVATLTDSMLDLTSEVGDLAGVMGDLAETVGEGIEDIADIEDRISAIEVAIAEVEKVVVEHWTEMVEPDRVAVLEGLASDFMAENPDIIVKIVPVSEDVLPERVAAAKAAGRLPDTVRIFLDYVSGWTMEGLLDPNAATEVIEELGAETWGAGALELFKSPIGPGYSAVPTDGWVQGIWYRKDLFEANGLEPPTTWDRIETAAATLNNPTEGFYGIVFGTHPEMAYTQQCYEHYALSVGARAFDEEGNIVIDTPEQVAALEFFASTLAQYTPPLPCTWKEANQYYLTNKTAMMMYSTYIIDDILGVQKRDWAPIPGLAEKTGFVPTIEGRGTAGVNATYGQLVGFGITTTADTEAAKKWVKYILDDRLFDYISMSIVGMMPARTTVLDQWKQHEYFQGYAPGLAEQIISGFENIGRWGYHHGKSFPLIAQIYGQVVVPEAIGSIIDGVRTPSEAATWIQTQVEAMG